jgi:hypothetical protein
MRLQAHTGSPAATTRQRDWSDRFCVSAAHALSCQTALRAAWQPQAWPCAGRGSCSVQGAAEGASLVVVHSARQVWWARHAAPPSAPCVSSRHAAGGLLANGAPPSSWSLPRQARPKQPHTNCTPGTTAQLAARCVAAQAAHLNHTPLQSPGTKTHSLFDQPLVRQVGSTHTSVGQQPPADSSTRCLAAPWRNHQRACACRAHTVLPHKTPDNTHSSPAPPLLGATLRWAAHTPQWASSTGCLVTPPLHVPVCATTHTGTCPAVTPQDSLVRATGRMPAQRHVLRPTPSR